MCGNGRSNMYKTENMRQESPCKKNENAASNLSQKAKHCCKFCGKLYERFGCFKVHEKNHLTTKEKIGETSVPFKCSECGRYFANRKRLLFHKKKDHASEKAEDATGGVINKKIECGKHFLNRELLIAHEETRNTEGVENQNARSTRCKQSLSQRKLPSQKRQNIAMMRNSQSGFVSITLRENSSHDIRSTVGLSKLTQKCMVMISKMPEDVPASSQRSTHTARKKGKILKMTSPEKCGQCGRYFSTSATLAIHISTSCTFNTGREPTQDPSNDSATGGYVGLGKESRRLAHLGKVQSTAGAKTNSSAIREKSAGSFTAATSPGDDNLRRGDDNTQPTLHSLLNEASESVLDDHACILPSKEQNSALKALSASYDNNLTSLTSSSMQPLPHSAVGFFLSPSRTGICTGFSPDTNPSIQHSAFNPISSQFSDCNMTTSKNSSKWQKDTVTVEISDDLLDNANERSSQGVETCKDSRRRKAFRTRRARTRRSIKNRKRSDSDITTDQSGETLYGKSISWSKARKKDRMRRRNALGLYVCNVCSGERPNAAGLASHMLQRAEDHPHSCDKCGGRFATENMLKEHEITHTKTRRFTCHHCDRVLATADGLKHHVMLHTGERPRVCSMCGMKFRGKFALKCHVKTHVTAKPYSCELCQKNFSSKKTLQCHANQHAGLHTCSYCGKSLNCSAALMLHVTLHTGEKHFLCVKCGMKFRTPLLLNRHIVAHHGPTGPHTCNICQKSFSTKTVLQSHVSLHARTYVCEHCGTKLATAQTLKDHIARHSDKRYVCPVCDRKFITAYRLKYHMPSHDGTNPYRCDICRKDFCTKYSFQHHVKRNTCARSYDQDHAFSDREERYRCPECDMCLTKETLSKHMREHLISN